jgi:hypothetical protein
VNKLLVHLRSQFTVVSESLNPNGPKRQAFEIYIAPVTEENRANPPKLEQMKKVWSGVNRGPPRKEKFPDPADIEQAVRQEAKAE